MIISSILKWIWVILLSSIIYTGLNRIKSVREYRLGAMLLLYTAAILLHFSGMLTQKYLGNNYWTYNLFTLTQTGLILYSISTWTQTRWLKFTCLTLILLNSFILMSEIVPFYPQFYVFADRAVLSSGLSIIAMNAFYMFELSNTSQTSLVDSPLFWITSGLLLYFSISDVLLYTMSLVSGIKAYGTLLNLVHLFVYILAAVLQLKGFRCLPHR